MDSLKCSCELCHNLFTLKDKRSIKSAKDGFICRDCSLNKQRLNKRIELLKSHDNILWDKTKEKYGYDFTNIKPRNNVLCSCIECGKELEIQYRGAVDLSKKASRARHKKCFKHTKESIIKSAKASRKYWSNPESHNLASSIISGLWQDVNFRNRVVSSLLARDDYNDRSKRSKEMWNKKEFRDKLLNIMQSPEHKKLKSEIMTPEKREFNRQLMIELWADESYREKMANTAFWSPQPSKLQRKLIPILKSFNIRWEEEHLIKFWHFDYYLPDLGILIEVQGNYWHTKPEVITRDKRKRSFVQNNTKYQLIEIWENEFKNNKTLTEKIKNLNL